VSAAEADSAESGIAQLVMVTGTPVRGRRRGRTACARHKCWPCYPNSVCL